MIHKRERGNQGEDLACRYIERQGFVVVSRNFQRKWGELDIIAKKDRIVHFFEVKSVTCDMSSKFFDIHRPEDNVDGWKVKHLKRMIETYLADCGGGIDSSFCFHVICVYIDTNIRRARVKWLKDIVL